MTSANNKTTRTKRKGPYTSGELNKMIDSTLHPLFRESPLFMLVDEMAHAAVEQNPKESAVKFVRYTLPQIIKKILEAE